MKELAHPQDVAAPIDDREVQTGVPEAVREGEALPLSYSQQQLIRRILPPTTSRVLTGLPEMWMRGL